MGRIPKLTNIKEHFRTSSLLRQPKPWCIVGLVDAYILGSWIPLRNLERLAGIFCLSHGDKLIKETLFVCSRFSLMDSKRVRRGVP